VSPSATIEQREKLMAAAGFTIRPADSAKRQALLATLPPHHFVQRAKDGQAIFLYADPLVCNCLYIGNNKAYDNYQSAVLQQQLAKDELGDQGQLREETEDGYGDELRVIEADEEGWAWEPWEVGGW
jgi:hypothetical protein